MKFRFLPLLAAAISATAQSAREVEAGRPPLFLREDFEESPAATPVTQDHLSNKSLLLGLYGPGKAGMKKSHHEKPADDPYYIWDGTCTGNCAATLRSKASYADLTGLAKIRWRTMQSGFRRLHLILKLAGGSWLVGDVGEDATTDWHESEIAIRDIRWRQLDIRNLVEGAPVGHPDLSHVDEIGWSTLMTGGQQRRLFAIGLDRGVCTSGRAMSTADGDYLMRIAGLTALWLASLTPLFAGPKPGDVYREFIYRKRFSEVDPVAKRKGIDHLRESAMAPRMLDLPSMNGVVRAEMSVEYWGGHIGTSQQKFRANGAGWLYIQQPQNTKQQPECYHRTLLGRADTEIPLSQLKEGMNEFRFTAGPQLCNSFDWGFYWVYSFTVRLYYKGTGAHGTAELVLPASGGEIGENAVIAANVHPDGATIAAVDFIGNYRDFNWEGDGIFRQWHYITERGAITHHIGTATRAPYAVRWDTTWIPDQEEPVELAARVTDSLGRMTITPAIKVNFRRRGRSVKMYTSSDVPISFGVRVGRRKECSFDVNGDLSKARAARLMMSTWSAAHDGEMGLNGSKLVDRIGFIHNYSFDTIPVPTRLINPGVNKFYVTSDTQEHAPEINWPGPVLLVEYGASEPAAGASAARVTVEDLADFEGQPSFRVRTPSATYIYHKEGAAFASIKDNAGVEWVGYHPGNRSAGEFRGVPNLGDEFGHPGHHGAAGSISRAASLAGDHVRIISERRDGKWACQWDIFPTHATMTLLRNDKPYWFLYEGTPAGRLSVEHGYFMLSDGTRHSLASKWSDAGTAAAWVYFADPASRSVLFLATHDPAPAPWQYWPMDGNMTVFGFGRELSCCGKYLNQAPQRFTIGITEDRGFDATARTVEAALR